MANLGGLGAKWSRMFVELFLIFCMVLQCMLFMTSIQAALLAFEWGYWLPYFLDWRQSVLSMLVAALQVCVGDSHPVLQLNLLHSPVACAIPSMWTTTMFASCMRWTWLGLPLSTWAFSTRNSLAVATPLWEHYKMLDCSEWMNYLHGPQYTCPIIL